VSWSAVSGKLIGAMGAAADKTLLGKQGYLLVVKRAAKGRVVAARAVNTPAEDYRLGPCWSHSSTPGPSTCLETVSAQEVRNTERLSVPFRGSISPQDRGKTVQRG